MAIDVESLLVEVSAEAPCGEDIAYDPSFVALEDLVRTKAADSGMLDVAGERPEEPNWRQVRESSLELLQRSKPPLSIHQRGKHGRSP